ncbi:uncharacterized protein MONOS_14359 [Monocercomonoides exilis]|uniref:uncharacterized protein n=1 Tax=Monocercomonoides exilis TaxID=2049356 RepID=UPI0035599EA3|nr:hypothetical protein MONOS_14359 [Monocercomonoides exilis]|eukprot:MONOS_14359.1-p1 / transcript=MONOS_14359.1 / gene=MONOS_14359 / organism=Monocercomonoides_exilis_PA203 / gene_product=unspecified product / transcript_product=unspecified product / location=Mono_scaffold00988:17515-18789(-) / protein_length=384 / sequence_SO=supercontig / SO=protein_coding / is_pseudo=false
MDERNLETLYSAEMFNEIGQMIEDEELSLEKAILLLKQMGRCKMMESIASFGFDESQLSKRLAKMAVEEEKKNERKNKKLLVDVCECHLSLFQFYFSFEPELLLVCQPCLLEVALSKEESEERQKEVEMALLALSCIPDFAPIEKERYVSEMAEIIEYHEEHRNLTHLASQSAWLFFVKRIGKERELEKVIVKELDLMREAARELEELKNGVDWEKTERRVKKRKEVRMIRRWFGTLWSFFSNSRMHCAECAEFVRCVAKTITSAKESCREVFSECFGLFRYMVSKDAGYVGDLLKGGAVDVFLQEMQQSTIRIGMKEKCTKTICDIFESLSATPKEQSDEEKRKIAKKDLFENLEEEGFEDAFLSFFCSSRDNQILLKSFSR